MKTPRQPTAALGAGFYRYWHVPDPDGSLDIRATRRADLSVIGPAALAVLGVGAWFAGRVGSSLLLDERVTVPLSALPWTPRVLAVIGALALVLAALWWLVTAPVRTRVARGVATGSVARIPDDPSTAVQPLHAAVTELGRALRELPEPTPLAEPAFEVLRTAAAALSDGPAPAAPDQRRLRRRCLNLAQRLENGRGDEPARGGPDHLELTPRPDAA
ncbi:MAG: hypothetical protein M3165_10835 [Actinomycetota bacterium]|nr:hypothetical protein [Actinomycetota bacterium]